MGELLNIFSEEYWSKRKLSLMYELLKILVNIFSSFAVDFVVQIINTTLHSVSAKTIAEL
jgi:hypothetical protein